MIYYLAALIWIYFISVNAYRLPVLTVFPASLPIVIFSAFRGESGKDTPLYIMRFFSVVDNSQEFTIDSEPLLSELISISKNIFGNNVEGFFALHAFLLFICYFLIAKKIELNKAYLLSVGPVFLLDGITNGMRITIAYHALLLGYTYGKKPVIRLVFILVALLAHITSIVSFFLAALLHKPRGAFIGFVIICMAFYMLMIQGSFDLIALAPRIFSKMDRYSDLVLPSWHSGLVDILTLLAILSIAIVSSSMSATQKFLLFTFATLFCAGLYLGIQQSLAFIRVSKLAIIAVFVSGVMIINKTKKFSYLVSFIGLLYSFNFMRQVVTDPGFLPYGQ